jgi:hypothetical protein
MRNSGIEAKAVGIKLGILILSKPESPDLETIQPLCQAAMAFDPMIWNRDAIISFVAQSDGVVIV